MKTKKVTEFTHGLTTKDLPMYPSNMKELCLYVKQARKKVADEHRRRVAHHGKCSGLTDVEYRRMRIDGKKTYPQQRKFVHSKMWSQTHKKFDVKQLKLINKK
tara:strand:+ start:257 stop:565 length:309 start_codon:yes stop_codon:yes gene_type:complete